jgi:hypothetical protein
MKTLIVLLFFIGAVPASAEDEAHRADRLRTEALNRAVSADIAARDRRPTVAQRDYREAHARYERDMAAWRARVGACNGGDWSACR